ncbi:MAG: hypothetical protein U5L96_17410 [Owenweeksia sp.]|nr:hypothetical protein [Owenweeksia sp.]
MAVANNITVYLDSSGMAVVDPALVDGGSFDGNCNYNISLSDSIFDCAELGLNLESLIITDGAGNSQATNFFVTVMDTMSPALALHQVTLTLNQNGKANISQRQHT